MAINLKAYKSVDGEVVYLEESQAGDSILGPNYTRIQGLDRVVSNDLSESEDYEDTSELNTRDTNNRNRDNHTGTQLSTTVSDFQNAVTNNTEVLANTAKPEESPADGTQYSRVDGAWERSNTLYDGNGDESISVTSGGNIRFEEFGEDRVETGTIKYHTGVNNTGRIVQQIPLEGQVKINGSGGQPIVSVNFQNDIAKIFAYDNGALDLSASPVTQFPSNITNPTDADIVDPSTFRFLENPIEGQVHYWRIEYRFANKGGNNNLGVTIGLRNPVSGFTITKTDTLFSSAQLSPNVTFPDGSSKQLPSSLILVTVADSASIGTGYQLFGATTNNDNNLTITIDSVTRISTSMIIR
jgi:hypothetical protein